MNEEEFNLSEKMNRYEEPIEISEIEHIVRQAHIKDCGEQSYYCVGCVERAILETIKKCKKDVKEFIRLLKEEFEGSKEAKFIFESIDKLAGDKLI